MRDDASRLMFYYLQNDEIFRDSWFASFFTNDFLKTVVRQSIRIKKPGGSRQKLTRPKLIITKRVFERYPLLPFTAHEWFASFQISEIKKVRGSAILF